MFRVLPAISLAGQAQGWPVRRNTMDGGQAACRESKTSEP